MLEKGEYIWRKLATGDPDPLEEFDRFLLEQACAALECRRTGTDRLVLIVSCDDRNDALFKACREMCYDDVFASAKVDFEKEDSGSPLIAMLKSL